MSLTKPYRLYAVTIHDTTTREAIVPKYELGVIKAAWRVTGTKLTITPTDDVREVTGNGDAIYKSLVNRYNARAVASFYPGPERLEGDMESAAAETATWLKERKAWDEKEAARVRAISAKQNSTGGKPA